MSEDQVKALAKRLLDLGLQDLTVRERRMIEQIAAKHAISRDVQAEFEARLTYGEHLSDRVAEIGGSWGFIIAFGVVMVLWTGLNSFVLGAGWVFDPYPYVFLNLLLSLLAAIQAPIIMMSQNRQSDKDRLAAKHDYEVNLKAEIEIMALHDKVDQLRAQELGSLLERVERALVRVERRAEPE